MLLAELVRFFFERGFLDFQLHDLAADGIEFRGHAVEFSLDESAGFVNKVDCLVRQKPVGDIAFGERCRRNQRRILNLDAVEHLVAFF